MSIAAPGKPHATAAHARHSRAGGNPAPFARYAKYKDSGIAWLGDVPSTWMLTKVKHICQFTTGWTPPTGDADAYVGDNPWANISDLGPKTLVECARHISDDAVQKSSITLSPAGSLLFSFKLSIGQVSFAGVDMYTNEAIATFHASEALDLAFAYYAFPLYVVKNAAENIYGAKLLNQELIRSAQLLLPDRREQSTIAAFLDRETAKIDALIAEQEKLIALLKEKRQALISHAVTKGLDPDAPVKDSGIEWLGQVPAHWAVTRCGRFVSILSGFAFPSYGFDHDGNGTRLLRGINVGVGAIRWDDAVYWARRPQDGLDAYGMNVGDIVIGMDRPLISEGIRVAKLTSGDVPSLLLQRVASIRSSDALDGDFFAYILASPMFVSHFAPNTTGVSVPHISPEQIASFIIAIPPLSEQRAIVSRLADRTRQLDMLTTEAERNIALLKERRAALISAAVTGKIDVRGAAGESPLPPGEGAP